VLAVIPREAQEKVVGKIRANYLPVAPFAGIEFEVGKPGALGNRRFGIRLKQAIFFRHLVRRTHLNGEAFGFGRGINGKRRRLPHWRYGFCFGER